jgi:hypothetical protein
MDCTGLPEFVTRAKAARYLGTSPHFVARLDTAGALDKMQIGTRTYYLRRSIERLKDRLQAQAGD